MYLNEEYEKLKQFQNECDGNCNECKEADKCM